MLSKIKKLFLSAELNKEMFRKSDDVELVVGESYCEVSVPKDKRRIHVIQFNDSLTIEHSYFCAQIVKLSKSI
jgi:hypothetical protein